MIIDVDNSGRITIPKTLRDILNIEDKVYIVQNDRKELIISPTKRYDAREMIDKKLKSNDLRVSERNFLEKLKGVL